MIANGTIKTIEDEDDIYISLTSLCDYFTKSSINMKKQAEAADIKDQRYAQGLVDMMFTISQELVELGKFEAQRRMINSPQDLLDMIDKKPFGNVE
jgi:ATP-dependent helicase YprA (DUF1998 family)